MSPATAMSAPYKGTCDGCHRSGLAVRQVYEPIEGYTRRNPIVCDGCLSSVPRTFESLDALDVLGRSRDVAQRPARSRDIPSDVPRSRDVPNGTRSRDTKLGPADSLTTDPTWAVKVAALWNVTTGVGEDFSCPIPGHNTKGCRAALTRMPNGRILLVDHFTDGDDQLGTRAWRLADVHAQVTAGVTWTLTATDSTTWLYRLAADAGYLGLPQITAQLPDLDVGESARLALDGFLLLLRVRHAAGALGKVAPPFTRRFRMRWTGLSERRARDGWTELRNVGAVHPVGEFTHGRRRGSVWLPTPYRTPGELFGLREVER